MSKTTQAENRESWDFEGSLTELEKIVNELDGEVKLERALKLFERGMKLSTKCQSYLVAAEQKVEMLKRNQAGQLSLEPFVEAEDEID